MVHKHKDNLTGEHTTGDIGQLVLFCLFMTLWISDIFLKYSSFPNEYLPVAVRIPVGIIILAVSGYLAVTSIRIVFGNKEPSPGVIRQDLYKFVRHPMYLSEILLYLGLLILSISLAAAFIWVLTIFFLHSISRYEEKLLLARFGKEYEDYMKEVPMWFPRIIRK